MRVALVDVARFFAIFSGFGDADRFVEVSIDLLGILLLRGNLARQRQGPATPLCPCWPFGTAFRLAIFGVASFDASLARAIACSTRSVASAVLSRFRLTRARLVNTVAFSTSEFRLSAKLKAPHQVTFCCLEIAHIEQDVPRPFSMRVTSLILSSASYKLSALRGARALACM